MTKNTFFNYINHIIQDFDSFKQNVDNRKYKDIEKYFNDEFVEKEYSSNLFLSNAISFEVQLLTNKNAIQLYEMYIELITYLTSLKYNISNQAIRLKIRLTISMLQDDFIPMAEKLAKLEVLKLLNIMFHYEELLKLEKIPSLCKNFHLDLSTYLYLLGYDYCENSYEQFSFIPEKNRLSEIDSIAGNRRIHYRKKLTSDLTIEFLKSEKLNEILPILKTTIGDNAFLLLEDELKKLIEKRSKEIKKNKEEDGFQYFFTIK